MNSSAMRSSSEVVMPGWSASPSKAIVSATSCPARAMPSISCADFLMIMRKDRGLTPPGSDPSSSFVDDSRRNLLQRGLNLREHLVLTARTVHGHQVTAHAVVLDERLRLAVIVLEPASNAVVGVVGAALELGALAQPLERDVVGDLQREDDAERAPDLVE